MANDRRLRRCFVSSFDKWFDCFPVFKLFFVGFIFVVVARFNFAKNSCVINVGSFNNGIYVPSSEIKIKTREFFY